MEMTGAEAVCRVLENEGVKYVFGVPGNTEVPVLDALTQTREVAYVSAIHESVSMAMADGYARASGDVGVVLVHTTPGTSYVIGNLYNAYNAGTPIVVLAGMQDSRLQWLDPYLDSNLLPMVSEYTKSCSCVRQAQDIPVALHRAFKEATSPPTGPVFLAIPRDVQSQGLVFDESVDRCCRVSAGVRADRESLLRAAELLAAAEQPAIYAGREVPDAYAVPELVELAELLGAPVYVTPQVPKLIFPTNHPLYYSRMPPIGFSLPGLDGPADVLLAVGSQLFRQLFYVEGPLMPPSTKVIHLDLDARGVGRDGPVEVALMASPRTALAELASETNRLMSKGDRDRAAGRAGKLKAAREAAKSGREADFKEQWDAVPLRPSRAMSEIASALPDNAVVVDESIMLTTYVEYIMEFSRPGSFFSCNASLGWGLPASLGVSLADPERPVVALVGDGSALFGLHALWTAARYAIPAVLVVLNNRGYAAIKWAFSMYPGRASKDSDDLGSDLGEIDFTGLAKAFGMDGRRIGDPAAIGPAIRQAIAAGRPMLLDILVDPRDVGYGLPSLQ